MTRLKREDPPFFCKLFCSGIAHVEDALCELCSIFQIALRPQEFSKNKAPWCLGTAFEGLVVGALWQTGWKLDIVLLSMEEILPVLPRL